MLHKENIIEVIRGGEYPVILTQDIFRGEKRIDLRTYYRKMDGLPVEKLEEHIKIERSGEFSHIGLMPTKKGISLNVDSFFQLQEAVVKLADSMMPSTEGKGKKK